MAFNQLRAEAWTTHAKTSVVMDDETTITGKRVIAECDTEEYAALFASAHDLLDALQDMLHVMEQHEQLSGCECSIGDAARAAITKATGCQS